jgi:hypothetical protein
MIIQTKKAISFKNIKKKTISLRKINSRRKNFKKIIIISNFIRIAQNKHVCFDLTYLPVGISELSVARFQNNLSVIHLNQFEFISSSEDN